MGLFDAVGDAIGGAVGSAVGDAFGAAGDILNVVFPSIDQITRQFGNYQNLLDSVVKVPIETMLGQVENDGIWKGDGADLFVNECRSTFLPETKSIGDVIGRIVAGLNESKDIMTEADKTASQTANDLLEQIKGISKYF